MGLFLKLADDHQKVNRDQLTFSAWGESLNLEQFLIRENELRQTKWCRKVMKTWLLLNTQFDVLASCETFQMNNFFNGVLTGISIGIGSVFVEPKFRGKRYAQLLLNILKEENLSFNQTFYSYFLFSEIGESFYSNCGFIPFESLEWSFPVQSAPSKEVSKEIKIIYIDDLSENLYLHIFQNVPSFAIIPTLDQLEWHLKREFIYSKLLQKQMNRQIGIKLNKSFLIWMIDYKYDLLRVLISNFENKCDATELLQSALSFSKSVNLRGIKIWKTHKTGDYMDSWNSEYLKPRHDSLCMINRKTKSPKPSEWSLFHRSIWI